MATEENLCQDLTGGLASLVLYEPHRTGFMNFHKAKASKTLRPGPQAGLAPGRMRTSAPSFNSQGLTAPGPRRLPPPTPASLV